jgi:hypothetical protein
MMQILKKTYTFQIVIQEGNDEFWEELNQKDSTGCDELLKEMKAMLAESGILYTQTMLMRYEVAPPLRVLDSDNLEKDG